MGGAPGLLDGGQQLAGGSRRVGALKTALTTATLSAPALNAGARFSAVTPPIPTIGNATRLRASASMSGPAGSASGLVGVLNSAPKPI